MKSAPVEQQLMAPGTSPWRHLPNLLTALRMLMVVPLAWLILDGHYRGALLVAASAGATDALDGLLAKRYGWQSWLGGVLDPIADKLMLLACFLSLGMVGAHPFWLVGLVIGRDVVIVAGAVAYHHFIGRLNAEPTLLSKITTCVQIVYVLAQLLRLTRWFDVPLLTSTLMWAAIAFTVVSGMHYVLVWSRRAAAELRLRRASGSGA
jgi:cardiolipin synthase